MNQLTKLLLGVLTLWPFAYVVLFFVVVFATEFFMPGTEQPGPPSLIALILPLHLLTMVTILALLVFYVVNVFNNERVEKDKKALWAIVLLMGGAIAMPIYWYIYIWKSAPAFNNRSPDQLFSGNSASSINDVNADRRETEYVFREPPNWRE